jgi:aspartyl-tRNA(Asn)/glutamyl-tRNA(Gln) amidotransferase subunit A
MSQATTTGLPQATATSDPADLGLLGAARLLDAGRLSAVELTEACLRRIEERNGGPPSDDGAADAVNAWARVYPELAHEHARRADERRHRDGDAAPLVCGIPLALKDLYGVAGLPLTASSRVLAGNVAGQDSTVWARLRDQGMVPLGHTHTHEFAAGGTTDQVGNPWRLDLIVGGSSGGSAAALAARMTPAALGTDTCGSLRIPSACCGTSTIKPTHGRIPFDGIIPLAPSLDHAGPMSRTVADCAALLVAMARGGAQVTPLMPPPAPLQTLPLEPRSAGKPLQGVTIALTDRTRAIPIANEIGQALDHARRACESLGARVVELPAP